MLLRKITDNDKDIIVDLKKEIENYDNDFEGFSILKNMEDFYSFYLKLIDNENPSNENYSPQYTYLAFEDNELVGVVVLRTQLKGDLVNYGGNVGFLVRPSKRQKGYGTLLLKEALSILKNNYHLDYVVLGCRVDNIASSKVIENNGAIYVSDYFEVKNGLTFKKYEKFL